MSDNSTAKVHYLNYVAYQTKKDAGLIEDNDIYFVSETTALGSNMMSLYLGKAKQCDLLDITQDINDPENPIDYVSFVNNENIPESYKIPNKLFFYKEGSGVSEHYSILMYYVPEGEDRSNGRFLPCGSGGTTLVPDGITIIENPSDHVISGVGANVSGKTFTVDNVEYTATTGDTIFNNYTNNVAAGGYNNVFGQGNIALGEYSTVFGSGNDVRESKVLVCGESNTVKTYGSNWNTKGIVFGENNNVGNLSYSLINGGANNIQVNNGNANSFCDFVSGDHNTLMGNSSAHNNVFGSNISITNGNYNNIFGQNTTLAGSTPFFNTIFSYGNISMAGNTLYSNFVIGNDMQINGNSYYDNIIHGTTNRFSGNSISGNIFLGHYIYLYSGNDVAYNHVFGRSVHMYLDDAADNLIFGTSHDLGSSSTNIDIDATFIGGRSHNIYGNTEASFIFGSGINATGNNNYIFGSSVNITGNNKYVIGSSLTATNSLPFQCVIGYGNDQSVTDSLFTISNSEDLVRLSTNGLFQLCGSSGNAVTVNGETIESTRQVLTSISADAATYTSAVLPLNGQELLLSTTYTVSSITITDISQMLYDNGRGTATKATSSEYNSVIIFKKDSSISSIDDLMTNFTSTTANKIYLLNPDLDISTYNIIHIMLFNDGFHICAIVAGYEEASS